MMNPQEIFCPEIRCPASGQVGKGNITIHSHQEKRYGWSVCGQTFVATKGTIFYRLKTDPVQMMLVITLLAYGCPVPAISGDFTPDRKVVYLITV